MSITLIIDSSFTFTIGLINNRTNEIIDFYVSGSARRHVEEIIPCVQKLLIKNSLEISDVKEIRAGKGPGPFTGLRAGIAAAIGLANGLGFSALGFSSLEAQAQSVIKTIVPNSGIEEILIINDARRKQVYWQRSNISGEPLGCDISFRETLAELEADERVLVAGNMTQRLIDPKEFLRAAAAIDASNTQPLYLRRPDVG